MTVSREIQPTHDLIVPLIVFCIGEEAERYASSVLQNSKRHICKVILSSRKEITARLIQSYRTQLQISRNIIVPVLMAEGNTLNPPGASVKLLNMPLMALMSLYSRRTRS